MPRQTNEERVVALLRRRPGLDDDEISELTGIGRRQQVNQICHRLEGRGVLMRTGGPNGKIVNELVDAPSPKVPHLASPRGRRGRIDSKTAPPVDGKTWHLPVRSDLSETLLIVPCSKSKAEFPRRQATGPRIGNRLLASLAKRLDLARAANRQRAGMDERTLAPAWQRYDGCFYQAAGGALAEAVGQRLHLLILSGGYGVLLAREPTGLYDAKLKTSWWPERALECVLAGCGLSSRVRRIVVRLESGFVGCIESLDANRAGRSGSLGLCAALTEPARHRCAENRLP